MGSAASADALLASNCGVVRCSDLVHGGVSRGWLRRRIDRGLLFELFPGVIAVSATTASRLLAAQVYGGEDARLSHTTAARLFGLSRGGHDGTLHVAVPHGRKRRRHPGLVLHQSVHRGFVVSGPLRLVPLSQTLVDLADLLGPDDARFVAAEAARRGLVTASDLRSAVRVPRRVAGQWADLLEEIQAGAWSGGEAKYWRAVTDARLPVPQLNARVVVGAATFLIDALWLDYGLGAEIDGRSVHALRSAFEADRARQNTLQAANIVLIRFPVSEVMHDPLGVAAQTRAALVARAHELRLPRRMRARLE